MSKRLSPTPSVSNLSLRPCRYLSSVFPCFSMFSSNPPCFTVFVYVFDPLFFHVFLCFPWFSLFSHVFLWFSPDSPCFSMFFYVFPRFSTFSHVFLCFSLIFPVFRVFLYVFPWFFRFFRLFVINENVEFRSRHNCAPLQLVTSCFLPSVVRHGRGKLRKRKVTVWF